MKATLIWNEAHKCFVLSFVLPRTELLRGGKVTILIDRVSKADLSMAQWRRRNIPIKIRDLEYGNSVSIIVQSHTTQARDIQALASVVEGMASLLPLIRGTQFEVVATNQLFDDSPADMQNHRLNTYAVPARFSVVEYVPPIQYDKARILLADSRTNMQWGFIAHNSNHAWPGSTAPTDLEVFEISFWRMQGRINASILLHQKVEGTLPLPMVLYDHISAEVLMNTFAGAPLLYQAEQST